MKKLLFALVLLLVSCGGSMSAEDAVAAGAGGAADEMSSESCRVKECREGFEKCPPLCPGY